MNERNWWYQPMMLMGPSSCVCVYVCVLFYAKYRSQLVAMIKSVAKQSLEVARPRMPINCEHTHTHSNYLAKLTCLTDIYEPRNSSYSCYVVGELPHHHHHHQYTSLCISSLPSYHFGNWQHVHTPQKKLAD